MIYSPIESGTQVQPGLVIIEDEDPREKLGLYHAEVASTRFLFASDGGLSEGYGHDGPGVCLGDGQTEAEGVPSQGGRSDALLRRMPPHLT